MKVGGALHIHSIDDYVVDYAHYHLFALLVPDVIRVTQLNLLRHYRRGLCNFEISESRRRAAKCIATCPIGALSS